MSDEIRLELDEQQEDICFELDGPPVPGKTGNGIASIVMNPDYTLTINYTDGTSYTTPSIRGEEGNGISNITVNSDYSLTIHMDDGSSYSTPPVRGPQGEDGVGIQSIAKTGSSGLVDTYTITLTDGSTTSFTVTNGTDGQDGFSPTITVTNITGGHRLTITDKNGTRTVDVMDGAQGDPGFSPTVTVVDITGGHRVTITDSTGSHSFDVMDGTDAHITVDSALSDTSENPVQNKVIKEEVDGLIDDISQLRNDTLTPQIKQSILDLFAKVAYADADGEEYLTPLSNLFFPNVASISAVFTQGDVHVSDGLDALRQNLVVTATMKDSTQAIVPDTDYTLHGTLQPGLSTITVSYGGKSTTFNCYVIYELTTPQTIDASNGINTGWKVDYASALTMCLDISFSAFGASNEIVMAFSNHYLNCGDAYFGMQAMLSSSGSNPYFIWGGGIAYSDRTNAASGYDRVRFVISANTETGYTTNQFYNVTRDRSYTRSNTYSTSNIKNGHNIFIGKSDGDSLNGVSGTVNRCKIYGRALTATEISDFLAGN